MKNFRWDKKYLYWGVTAFLVIAAAIIFYMIVNNLGWLGDTVNRVAVVISPFIWGFVIAYLLFPLMKIYQRYLFRPLAGKIFTKGETRQHRIDVLSRGLAVFLSIISLIIIVGGLFWLVIPQLVSSVERIVTNSEAYIATADAWITNVLMDYPEIEENISEYFGDVSNGIFNWASTYLLPQMKNILTNVTSSVYYVLRGVYNVIIGIIVSVYMLCSFETFAAHGKKILYAVLSLEASEKVLDAVHFVNKVFMGFISGKLLDSLIIGILCYIGCSILRIPFAMLCAFLVGVTNIIPFFGPLFGMIPSAFIILMESPIHALIFVVFVILLQQFDGNILGPKILGSRVGIGGFWVMFAIILGAGFFGFAGMLLGVPVFVVIYTLIKNLVHKKLSRSGLPVETDEFKTIDHIDPQTGMPVSVEHAKQRPSIRKKKNKKKEAAKMAASSEKTEKTEDISDV